MSFRSFRLQPPDAPCRRFDTLPISAAGFPAWAGSGLRHSLAGSPMRPAESSSSSCRLSVRLRLLSTSSRDNAVSIGYRPENVCLEGTCTLLCHARSQAHWGGQLCCTRNECGQFTHRRGRVQDLRLRRRTCTPYILLCVAESCCGAGTPNSSCGRAAPRFAAIRASSVY